MKLTAFIAALLLATTATAQTTPPAAPTYTFALKGFVSATGGYQTGTFSPSEGQLSNFATTGLNLKDDSSVTFDVRHSRFNFSVKGPQVVMGATPTGILEIDFMGGYGAGANGNTSLLNRLRIAVAELNWGNHKLQFGQQNDLIFAMAPTSLSHIGQPLGYGTGNSGFRRPGIFGFHTFAASPDLKVEGAWEVGRGSWNDAVAATAITLAEASASPALEGRVTVNYTKLLTAWAAAHWHQVDLTGVGTTTAANTNTITVTSYNAGAKASFDVKPVTLTLQGTGFIGQNAGPLAATLGSGYGVGPDRSPDVASWGWWAQAGVGFDKLSLWALYGQQKVDEKDFGKVTANDETKAFANDTLNLIAMYRDGGFALSAEWINFSTKYAKDAAAIVRTAGQEKINATRTAKADQYLLTANYFF